MELPQLAFDIEYKLPARVKLDTEVLENAD